MASLAQFGWTDEFQEKWDALKLSGLVPARVVADFGTSLKIATPTHMTAELSGKLAHYTDRESSPKVGDWVGVRLSDNNNAVIEVLVPRSSEIARKIAGKKVAKQIIAANVDMAFVLLALDSDFSVERLERFLYQLSNCHVSPIIVLNKADKVDDIAPYLESLHALNLPIVVSVASEGSGVAEILSYIQPGQTTILLGSSGVGKSTLTNALLGRDAQATKDVRASDETGRHTTVHRELFMLPGGRMLIDTPGIRELQLWGTQDELNDTFDDVTALTLQCKYTTCRHGLEEGCVIRTALQDGSLAASRFANYEKMKSEVIVLNDKVLAQARRPNKRSKDARIGRRDDNF